jgi:proteasome accessory factor B
VPPVAEGLSPSAARLTRLLTLVSTLTETSQPLTARELRERIDAYGGEDVSDVAFRAMFERDKKELRALGIDVDVVELDNVHPPETGYRIARSNYALRDPGLTPHEAAAVQLALSLVRLEGLDDGGDGGGVPDLWKLGAPAADHDGGPVTAIPGDPTLTVLFEALRERRVATFGYRGERRTVEPLRLQFARGRWYLTGRDVDRGEGRLFRLDRFDDVPAVGPPDRVEPAGPGELAGVPEPWRLSDGDAVTVRIAVDGPQAGLARRILGEDSVVAASDDRVELRFEVTHLDGFRSFLLGFLEHAEVLEPPEVREDVRRWLENVP